MGAFPLPMPLTLVAWSKMSETGRRTLSPDKILLPDAIVFLVGSEAALDACGEDQLLYTHIQEDDIPLLNQVEGTSHYHNCWMVTRPMWV